MLLKEQLDVALTEGAEHKGKLQERCKLLTQLEGELERSRAEKTSAEAQCRGLQAQLDGQAVSLQRKDARLAELDTEEYTIRRVAELMVCNTVDQTASWERRRAAQRRLLVCLHPDKCPATRIATLLTQEVQRTSLWVN